MKIIGIIKKNSLRKYLKIDRFDKKRSLKIVQKFFLASWSLFKIIKRL